MLIIFSLCNTAVPRISFPGVWYELAIVPVTGNWQDLPELIVRTVVISNIWFSLPNEANTSPENHVIQYFHIGMDFISNSLRVVPCQVSTPYYF